MPPQGKEAALSSFCFPLLSLLIILSRSARSGEGRHEKWREEDDGKVKGSGEMLREFVFEWR